MERPEIAILVSSYQRPLHLRRCLLSLALQRDVAGKIEVVVTDDGEPETSLPIVADFARRVDFPVRFTTHSHEGFRLACCRNEGIAISTAPYLLITDGDCLLPPDHLKWHLQYRRQGRVVLGDCYRLDAPTSDRTTEDAILRGEYLAWVSPSERRRMAGKAFRAWWYRRFRCTMHPRMTGSNIGIWRSDLERVNGFDENYVGWGLEDRDLQLRLSHLGLEFQSILRRTIGCHLWHPPAPSFVRNNLTTRNLTYFQRTQIPTRCQVGLAERIQNTQALDLNQASDNMDVADVLPFPRERESVPLDKAA